MSPVNRVLIDENDFTRLLNGIEVKNHVSGDTEVHLFVVPGREADLTLEVDAKNIHIYKVETKVEPKK